MSIFLFLYYVLSINILILSTGCNLFLFLVIFLIYLIRNSPENRFSKVRWLTDTMSCIQFINVLITLSFLPYLLARAPICVLLIIADIFLIFILLSQLLWLNLCLYENAIKDIFLSLFYLFINSDPDTFKLKLRMDVRWWWYKTTWPTSSRRKIYYRTYPRFNSLYFAFPVWKKAKVEILVHSNSTQLVIFYV